MLFSRICHILTEGVYAVGNRYLKRRTPTLIYAPGLVGSMALFYDLREAGVFVFKTESFSRKKFYYGTEYFAKRHIIDTRIKVNIITLIRDPIAILCTYYFGRLVHDLVSGASEAYRSGDIATLQKIFITDFLPKVLPKYIYWYENKWESQLGFSFFDHPFNIAEQFGRFEHKQYRVLALRTELNDEHKADAIADFLNLPHLVLTRKIINFRYNRFIVRHDCG